MTVRRVVTLGPIAAANAALFAASQVPVSGTPLTLTGSQPDVARRILLTFGNEAAARTLVATGTNSSGNPIQETLAVPSGAGGTVYSVQDFLTVVSALPLGGGWSAAVTLGTNAIASSQWFLTNIYMSPVEITFGCVVSGTVNYGLEYTYDDPNSNSNAPAGIFGNYPVPPTPWNHATLANLSANQDGTSNDPIGAYRLKLNSGSGAVTMTAIEAGIIMTR